MKALVMAGIVSALISTPTLAQQDGTRFLDRKAEGFFWYKDPIEPEEPEVVEEAVPPQAPTEPAVPEVAAEAPDVGPPPLSTAWIREHLPAYLDAAIDNPTAENVQAYMTLQKLAMDKATEFSRMTSVVVTGTDLDETLGRPSSQFGKDIVDEVAREKREALLNDIATQAGLFLFVENSRESLAQTDTFALLLNRHPFASVAVAMTPLSPDFKVLGDVRPDTGQAAQLNIRKYPAIALMRGDGMFDLLAQTVVSVTDLQDRILISALRLGIISQSDYDSTRTVDWSNSLAEPVQSAPKTAVPIAQRDLINAINNRGFQ